MSTPNASSWFKRAFTTHLYVTVLVAIVLGAAVGLIAPGVGASLQPLGDGWIALIRMLIGPVIFCAIVTGIASAGRLAGVGRIGIKAIVYFEVITTVALLIGLIVMNVLHPGAGIHANPADVKISGSATKYVSTAQSQHWYSFLVNIIPSTVVSAFVNANVLQVLLVAVLFASRCGRWASERRRWPAVSPSSVTSSSTWCAWCSTWPRSAPSVPWPTPRAPTGCQR